MVSKKITQPASEKISDAELYTLVKAANVIVIVEEKIHFFSEEGIWPVVSERAAVLSFRRLFADPGWQPYLSAERVRRIINSMKSDPELQKTSEAFVHSDLIKMQNGVWSISKGKLIFPGRELPFSRMLDVEVNEQMPTESTAFNAFCKRVFSPDMLDKKKQALLEIIGYCISDLKNLKKAIFLLGPANCGKSVLLRFIQRLVGDEYVSNVSLGNFAHRFSLIEMYGKTLNVNGEVPSGVLSSAAFDALKAITGGDRVNLERKGQQPFYGFVDAKLLFAGNMLPIFAKIDGTDSLVERLHLVIFDKSVEQAEIDKSMEERLWQDRNTIVRYALESLKGFVSKGNEFMKLEDELEMLEKISQTTNPLRHFVENCIIFEKGRYVHVSDVYDAYNEFAESEALPDMDRTTFRNLMVNQPGIEISKTKRRLGKLSPRVCFEGIKLRNEWYDDIEQDTKSYDHN